MKRLFLIHIYRTSTQVKRNKVGYEKKDASVEAVMLNIIEKRMVETTQCVNEAKEITSKIKSKNKDSM